MKREKEKNLIGKKFGYLTVVEEAQRVRYAKGYRYYWKCQCECGNFTVVREDSLLDKRRNHQSCGCHQYDIMREKMRKLGSQAKHGHSRESLFNIWYLIKYRCENAKCDRYEDYGGRGIKMCGEWRDEQTGYTCFKEWSLANGYMPGLSIDRIDNNGDYCPENCRWTDCVTQNRNTRKNVWIEYNGVTKLAVEWAEELRIPYKSFMQRIYRGWDIEKVITQPVRKRE